MDEDGDGWTPGEGDCDDTEAGINPSTEDVDGDGLDRDCDGSDRRSRRPEQVWTDAVPPAQELGYALAFGADIDRDGRPELTVGGPGVFSYGTYYAAGYGRMYQFATLPLASPIREWEGQETAVIPGVLPYLGAELAAGGDTDGDGFGEILATSKWTSTDDVNGVRQGVYVIRDLATPLEDSVVLEDVPGWRINHVAFSDVDGDGRDEVLVLSDTETTDGDNHFAQVGPPSTGRLALAQQDYLEFRDPQVGMDSIAPGDFDGDGQADVLLARSDGVDRPGTVYGCSSPTWTGIANGDEVCSDRWEGEHLDSQAGQRLEAGGDLDGDGQEDALVGSIFFNAEDHHVGRAYILDDPLGGGNRSLAEAHAHLTGEVREDRVGMGLEGPGDLDGDGHDDVLLGAASDDNSDYNPGRVYLFAGPVAPGALSPTDARIVFAGTDLWGEFGSTIVAGDLDSDGLLDLVFGAPYAEDGNGAIYVVPGNTL